MPEDTPQDNLCPQCSRPLPSSRPRGLCPACLLKRGLETNTVGFSDEGQAEAARRWTPPTVEQLAPLFPELDIIELIGRGGMGAVYKAREKQLDRLVALKILPPGIGREDSLAKSFAQRFAREAQAMAKLSHPNIVTIYSFGSTSLTASGQRGSRGMGVPLLDATAHGPDAPAASPELYYFIMEYVDGLSLRQLLDRGTISPKEALAIVPQICDALQYAHDRGIVHRDIKPENILLNRAGQVKIADFGLAKLVGLAAPGAVETSETALTPEAGGASGVTQPGEKVMGTPQYMAPEQIERPREVDHRADIYSLGVVFYQMLTGELPKGRSGDNFDPPSRKVVIDVRLDEVVLRALEREPARRYQQVSEVKTRVETIVSSPEVNRHAPEPQQVRVVPVETWHRYVAVVVRREGKAVINWRAVVIDGVIMAYLFVLGVTIAHVSNPHREINVWLALLVGLALLSAIPIAVYFGLKRPIERLTPLDRPQPLAPRGVHLVGTRGGKPVVNWPAVLKISVPLLVIALLVVTTIELLWGDHYRYVARDILIACGLIFAAIGGMIGALRRRPPQQLVALDQPMPTPPALSPEAAAQIDSARQAVKAPAIGLIVAAGISFAVILAIVALFPRAVQHVSDLHSPVRSPADPGLAIVVSPAILIGLIINILIFWGAVWMMQLRNRGLAIASAILAIVAAAMTMLIAAPANLIGLPFGIWALVVLRRPETKEAFAVSRHRQMAPFSGQHFPAWPIAFSLAGLVWLAVWGYAIHLNDRPWKIMVDIVGFAAFQLVALALAIRLWRTPIGKVVAVASAVLAVGAMAFGSFVYLEGYKTVPLCPIEGLVTDAATGKPIAGAHVSDHIYGGSPLRPIKDTWTDSDGYFILRTRFEEHTLAASALGYETRLKLFPGGKPIINFNFALQPISQATHPAKHQVPFGPVVERVINDLDEGKGNEGLILATGQVVSLPPEFGRMSDQQRSKWIEDQGIDLFVEYVSNRWGFMSCGPQLNTLNAGFEDVSPASIGEALVADSQLEVLKRGGWTFYLLPKESKAPLTFALRTPAGGMGVLQIVGFTDNPTGARIRYKLLHAAPSVPHVLKTNPANFANNVDPSLDKITVTFDRPMMDKSWSFTFEGLDFGKSGVQSGPDAPATRNAARTSEQARRMLDRLDTARNRELGDFAIVAAVTHLDGNKELPEGGHIHVAAARKDVWIEYKYHVAGGDIIYDGAAISAPPDWPRLNARGFLLQSVSVTPSDATVVVGQVGRQLHSTNPWLRRLQWTSFNAERHGMMRPGNFPLKLLFDSTGLRPTLGYYDVAETVEANPPSKRELGLALHLKMTNTDDGEIEQVEDFVWFDPTTGLPAEILKRLNRKQDPQGGRPSSLPRFVPGEIQVLTDEIKYVKAGQTWQVESWRTTTSGIVDRKSFVWRTRIHRLDVAALPARLFEDALALSEKPGAELPERTGEISYDAARTTCTMPVKLQPGKVYWVGVNGPQHRNFKSEGGTPARPYQILFATRGADGKPTPLPEELVKQAREINAAAQPAGLTLVLTRDDQAGGGAEGPHFRLTVRNDSDQVMKLNSGDIQFHCTDSAGRSYTTPLPTTRDATIEEHIAPGRKRLLRTTGCGGDARYYSGWGPRDTGRFVIWATGPEGLESNRIRVEVKVLPATQPATQHVSASQVKLPEHAIWLQAAGDTARSFLAAMREGGQADPYSLVTAEYRQTHEGAMERLVERVDLSKAGPSQYAVAMEAACVVISPISPRNQDMPMSIGLGMIRIGDVYRIRDFDMLPSDEAVKRYLESFRKAYPAARVGFESQAYRAELMRQKADLELEWAGSLKKLGPEHPKTIEIQAKLRNVQVLLDHLERATSKPTDKPTSQPMAADTQAKAVADEFYVMGEVDQPGAYHLAGRKITVKMALAGAGFALGKKKDLAVVLIRRLRDGSEQQVVLSIDALIAGGQQDVLLRNGDVVAVRPIKEVPGGAAAEPASQLEVWRLREEIWALEQAIETETYTRHRTEKHPTIMALRERIASARERLAKASSPPSQPASHPATPR